MGLQTLLAVVVVVIILATSGEAKCGNRFHHQKFASLKNHPEIVGGKDAVRGAYPWQASIQVLQVNKPNLHFCGGSVVGHHWILTAAHCINVYMEFLPDLFVVAVGDHRLGHVEGSEQVVDIESIVKHENYDANTVDNDIALIRTKQKIHFGEFVQPVCLPAASFPYVDGTPTVVSGWGNTEQVIPDLSGSLRIGRKKGPNRNSLDVLQAARVPIVDAVTCNDTNHYQGMVTSNMICAGYLAGGIDSCQGDSGGPLVLHHTKKNKFVLVGITSWGIGCAAPNYPGVYTKVANYGNWILGKTNITSHAHSEAQMEAPFQKRNDVEFV